MDEPLHINDHQLPSEMQDDYERAAEWLDAMADGPLDELTQRRFAQWLVSNNQRRAIFERMMASWEDEALNTAAARYMNDLRMLMRPRRHLLDIVRPYSFALATSLLVALGVVVMQPWKQPAQGFDSQLSSATGRSKTWQLVDGSNVELSGRTQVAVHFSAGRRDLELQQGAAYFQVAHDKSRPFDVHIGDVSVVAVGTEFTIDKTRDAIEVVVHEGIVALREHAGANMKKLTVGQRARIVKGRVAIDSVDTTQLIDWRSDWIDVHNESLQFLVEHLNRYATIPIEVPSPDLQQQRVAGRFQLRNTNEALAILADLYGLDIRSRAGVQELVYKKNNPVNTNNKP